MRKFSFVSLVQFVLFSLFVGSAKNSAPDESNQLVPSVTVTSEDISSVHNATSSRVLKKKAKGSAKKSKASKSGKKVSKSSKALATVSPSQLSDELADQQSSQPSSSPTVDPCVAEGISTQKDALLALKDGFTYGGTLLIDWTSDTDPCDGGSSKWSYITCNTDGEVVAIDLYEKLPQGLGLEGTISPLIGCPTSLVSSLTYLDFYKNSLDGNIPTEIGMLTSLEYLDFGSNSLDGNIPIELGNLISLTNLYFDYNNLDGMIPTELGNLINLTVLLFVSNSLDGNIPTELGNLTSLTVLYFHNNNLNGNIPTELGNLINLTRLDFHHNNLDGSMPSEICELRVRMLINLGADCAGSDPEVDCASPSCCTYCAFDVVK